MLNSCTETGVTTVYYDITYSQVVVVRRNYRFKNSDLKVPQLDTFFTRYFIFQPYVVHT